MQFCLAPSTNITIYLFSQWNCNFYSANKSCKRVHIHAHTYHQSLLTAKHSPWTDTALSQILKHKIQFGCQGLCHLSWCKLLCSMLISFTLYYSLHCLMKLPEITVTAWPSDWRWRWWRRWWQWWWWWWRWLKIKLNLQIILARLY